MDKKVYIETLGCQMNKSDSERILGMLEHLNYTETNEPKEADLLMINTCNIRQLSADKAYSYLGVWGKWKKEKPHLKIAMCGCVAQQDREKVRQRAPYMICRYLQELASNFHYFYTVSRVLNVEKPLMQARLALVVATKQVLNIGLKLLGVSAPESM